MSSHNIYFKLKSRSHRGREIKLISLAGEWHGKLDLDDAAKRICEELKDLADHPEAIKYMLEGFAQESWETYCQNQDDFHGKKE